MVALEAIPTLDLKLSLIIIHIQTLTNGTYSNLKKKIFFNCHGSLLNRSIIYLKIPSINITLIEFRSFIYLL